MPTHANSQEYKEMGKKAFLEVNHEFLLLLHVTELVFINAVCVVEKQVILASQLDLHLMYLLLSSAIQK